MIYIVIPKIEWEAALAEGFYESGSLAVEGFIHASKQHQVQGVLERYFQNQSDLLLLHIDESKLTAEIKYELSPSVNEEFPHIFGRLNTVAVVKTTPI